jgi:hypothetical protein
MTETLTEAEEYKFLDRVAAECMIVNPTMEQPPVIHRFTNGMYIREIHMPGGTEHVSKIHKTQHPFVVSKGIVSVSADGETWTHLSAPHTGITEPGTQRFLVVHEDTVWTTFHLNPNNIRDIALLEEIIVDVPVLPPGLIDSVTANRLANK